jgi:hypothetical protein
MTHSSIGIACPAFASTECLFGLESAPGGGGRGWLVQYDLSTNERTIITEGLSMSGLHHSSTYDPENHRFFGYSNYQLCTIDTQTGTTTITNNVFADSTVSIEYDVGSDCLFGLETAPGGGGRGQLVQYDLSTGDRTIVTDGLSVRGLYNNSTYDPENHRFFGYSENQLYTIDTLTGTTTVATNAFAGSTVSIEYDAELDCLFGLEGGSLTWLVQYDLSTGERTILSDELSVNGLHHSSTYDPGNHRFFGYSDNRLYTIDMLTGQATLTWNAFDGTNVSIE